MFSCLCCSYANESAPDFVGPLAVNDLLKHGQRLFENEIIGPEAMALDKEGNALCCRILAVAKHLITPCCRRIM